MTPETVPIIIRGFLRDKKVFESRMDDLPEGDLVGQLGRAHAKEMAEGRLTMIEVEFLDDPSDPNRFFRMGVDMRLMVSPIEIDLSKLKRK